MFNIYSKINPNKLLHIVYLHNNSKKKRTNITPEDKYIQISCLNLDTNDSVKLHKHKECKREIFNTHECWIIIKGKVTISLYDINDSEIGNYILNQGDCLITFEGAHKFECLNDKTILYEVKNGPYYGNDINYIE